MNYFNTKDHKRVYYQSGDAGANPDQKNALKLNKTTIWCFFGDSEWFNACSVFGTPSHIIIGRKIEQLTIKQLSTLVDLHTA